MDQLGVGQTTIFRNNNVTEVILHTSKETLISTYLVDSLKAEVLPTLISNGVEYEIRTAVSQEELEELMGAVGGSILTDSSVRYSTKRE
jgi:preprotein translocase subunit SecD